MKREMNIKSKKRYNGLSKQEEQIETTHNKNNTLYQLSNLNRNFQSIEDIKKCNSLDKTRLDETLFNVEDQTIENSPPKISMKQEIKEERINSSIMKTRKKVPVFHKQGQINETPKKQYKNPKHLMDEFKHQSTLCLDKFISQQKLLQQRFMSELDGDVFSLHNEQKKKSEKLIDDLKRRISQQQKLLKNSQRLNKLLQRQNTQLNQQIQRLQQVHVESKDRWSAELEEMKEIENDWRTKIQILRQTVSNLQKQIIHMNNEKCRLQEQLQKQTSFLCEKDSQIHSLQQEILQKDRQIQERKNQLCDRRTKMDQQSISFDTETRERQARHMEEIQHVRQQKDQEIQKLKSELQEAKRYNQLIITQSKKDFELLAEEHKDHKYYFDSLISGHDLAEEYRIQLLQLDLNIHQINTQNQQLKKDLFKAQNQLLQAKGLHLHDLNQSST